MTSTNATAGAAAASADRTAAARAAPAKPTGSGAAGASGGPGAFAALLLFQADAPAPPTEAPAPLSSDKDPEDPATGGLTEPTAPAFNPWGGALWGGSGASPAPAAHGGGATPLAGGPGLPNSAPGLTPSPTPAAEAPTPGWTLDAAVWTPVSADAVPPPAWVASAAWSPSATDSPARTPPAATTQASLVGVVGSEGTLAAAGPVAPLAPTGTTPLPQRADSSQGTAPPHASAVSTAASGVTGARKAKAGTPTPITRALPVAPGADAPAPLANGQALLTPSWSPANRSTVSLARHEGARADADAPTLLSALEGASGLHPRERGSPTDTGGAATPGGEPAPGAGVPAAEAQASNPPTDSVPTGAFGEWFQAHMDELGPRLGHWAAQGTQRASFTIADGPGAPVNVDMKQVDGEWEVTLNTEEIGVRELLAQNAPEALQRLMEAQGLALGSVTVGGGRSQSAPDGPPERSTRELARRGRPTATGAVETAPPVARRTAPVITATQLDFYA